MPHTLPKTPFFHDAKPTDPIQELALRVIVELPGWEMYAVGTACLIGGHLAITAKHVVEYALRKFGARQGPNGIEVTGHSLRLLQVLPGPVYNIWNVFSAWICSTDIAILHLGLDSSSAPEQTINWRAPILRVVPPPSGQKVIAFGYRESKIDITEGANGSHHIEINDFGTTSAGEIGQIFTERRDSSMLTFPCFEVQARFAPGMSGGMIMDENGCLCGLVCAGVDFQDPNALPLSYAATLWPMLTTVISADRGASYPRGVNYPMIDLALDHQINAIGLENLDPKLFPGRTLPKPV
jgi:Trypsin-like peptidase domain